MYDVFWAPSALNDLTTLWLNADAKLREAITESAAQIDVILASWPNEVGESRTHDRRIAFEWPLGIIFQIQQPQQRVIVRHVWVTGYPKSK